LVEKLIMNSGQIMRAGASPYFMLSMRGSESGGK